MLSGLALGHRRDVSVPLPCYEPSLELLLGHWEDWERLPLPLLSQSWIKEPVALLPEPSPALRRAVRTWFCFLFFLFFCGKQ